MTSPPHPGPRASAPSAPQPVLPFGHPLPAAEASPGPTEPAPGRRPDRGVARVLADLGPQIRLGAPPQADAAPCATGIEALDRLLGGGFPRGRLCEVAGPEGGGRTSLLLAWVARLTATGAWVGWVDLADAFDPASAEAAGVDLERVLWVRPPDTAASLRAAEHVLTAGGFAGLVLDLTPPVPSRRPGPGADSRRRSTAYGPVAAAPSRGVPARRGRDPFFEPPPSAWPRLRRGAAAAQAALVVAARTRLAGTFADLTLETGPGRARFGEGPAWLEGLEASVRLVRCRGGAEGRAAPLSWKPAA
ncbi:MAG: hypothetical protein R3263_12260 [Myxococcota bacterium]|nr:hypothetical protein [Myxococcota bacterium]